MPFCSNYLFNFFVWKSNSYHFWICSGTTVEMGFSQCPLVVMDCTSSLPTWLWMTWAMLGFTWNTTAMFCVLLLGTMMTVDAVLSFRHKQVQRLTQFAEKIYSPHENKVTLHLTNIDNNFFSQFGNYWSDLNAGFLSGDTIFVYYTAGTDSYPLYSINPRHSSFNGFKIWTSTSTRIPRKLQIWFQNFISVINFCQLHFPPCLVWSILFVFQIMKICSFKFLSTSTRSVFQQKGLRNHFNTWRGNQMSHFNLIFKAHIFSQELSWLKHSKPVD